MTKNFKDFKSKNKEVRKMKGKIIIIMGTGNSALARALRWQRLSSSQKHDLRRGTAGAFKATAGQQGDQVCIWCHTPHFASAVTPALEQGSSSNCLHSVWNYCSRHSSWRTCRSIKGMSPAMTE